MANARLLSPIVIGGNNEFVVDYNSGGPAPYAITPGTYWMIGDGSGSDLAAEIKSVLDTATGDTWVVEVVGVVSHPGYAEGRLYLKTSNNPFEMVPSSGLQTLDPRVMGFTTTWPSPGPATSLYTPYVHRYGWYPQDLAIKEEVTVRRDTIPSFTSARYLDVVDDGEYGAISLGFDRIHPSLVTINDASWASAADMYLTAGDPNCAFERFCQDLAGDSTRRWRYYADITSASYAGPYVFGPTSVLWSNPAAACPVVEAAGKRRYVEVDGVEAGS